MSKNTNRPQRPNWQAQIARERGSKVRRDSEREDRQELAQQIGPAEAEAQAQPRPDGIGRPVRVPYIRR